ncbi:lyase family protein [Conexibacter sp. CPCC 206217]|uniref:lyase family protein n=1 Tax=Conexibacter sp. CPCC 206217 TaxID=3064574 RepID=UPI00271A3BC6|nr:lyase family protein [Conexibacter sp. CPCC 206217]MDO8212356.1 lyase family protein [Conexibacter sp. CPCC 206217]
MTNVHDLPSRHAAHHDPEPPPEGYLGAEARVRSGPAPELIEAGYELELADMWLLHQGLGLADFAHVIALQEQGEIPVEDAATLLRSLLELHELPPNRLDVDSRYGDLSNVRERWLERRIGPVAGWLSAGRPRREAGRIAFRLALRGRVLELAHACVRFGSGLADLAARERDTVMPDYTYLQAAQPTTVGHWVLSFVYPVLRDLERLRGDLAWVDRSPAGAGGVNGSRMRLDRERLAQLLGFPDQIAHTRDAMWQVDGFAELGSHAALAAVGASRFAEDLELYGTSEFGLLSIGDSLCRASALMPQKRNPYALVVLRGGAGTLIGRSTGLLATQRTSSGRTDNFMYAYGELTGSVELAARLLRLAAATAESVTVDRAAMLRATTEEFTQAADLAEVVTHVAGIDYRSAYRVVGRAVAGAGDAGRGPEALTAAGLDAVAQELLGRPLGLTDAQVADALDPVAALATRTVPGGAARGQLDTMLRDCDGALDAAAAWIEQDRERIAAAEGALVALARERAAA